MTLVLTDREWLIVAMALESFAFESRRALAGIEDNPFMRSVRDQLTKQIEETEAVLKRVQDARES